METKYVSSVQGGWTLTLRQSIAGVFKSLQWVDYLFAIALIIGAVLAEMKFSAYMDGYEQAILFLSVPVLAFLGWSWAPLRNLMIGATALAFLAIYLYQTPEGGSLARSEQAFFLKYMLSSQSAILWMSVFFALSTLFYSLSFALRSNAMGPAASKLSWAAVYIGLTGMLVRWYESYLMGADIGHIPISNLYEVFILFCLITALFHLYYEARYQSLVLGAFVLWIILAAVAFIFWYSVSRDAHQIQPLVPALQSWWMKIHVPANFIGYGTFALAAMVAIAYLLKSKNILADRLPSLELLDDVMYKAIAVGFAFFTIATILGALWAAEAWGGYWSWDPKETWALIVWLNYAAWLHMRLMKGLRGVVAAWWALVGLLVTTFAFIGVNMFLSGLHSYGTL
ncbi:MAG: ABC-type transporter, permease component: cytochrome c assembly [Pseudomonadota bacterium]|jgi:cytochrome c-type biogenesis protein CcsB